ncbi:hypothetical protein DFQ26_009696 [Actinomortierella ambigua]|nr:hypothetical protein DFQ26_009696 [Actinomortierella ambigua]
MSQTSDEGLSAPDFVPFPVSSDDEAESDVEITLAGEGVVGGRGSGGGGREKRKIPKHMCKSKPQIYDNISVYAPPDMALIFKCSQKKADWYLSRSLARQLSPTSIQLTFVPAGRGREGDAYYLEERENKCVVCGRATKDAGASMLHVVPEQYRKWFPIRLKSHSSHDILVACPECNADWDHGATRLRKQIVQIYQVPLEGVGWIRDTEAGAVRSAAGAVASEWRRQWESQHLTLSSRDREEQTAGVMEDEEKQSGVEDSGCGQKMKAKKKNGKVKGSNILPPERLDSLENTVLQWWRKHHVTEAAAEAGAEAEVLTRKRDSTSVLDSGDDTEAPRKRSKESSGSTSTGGATTPIAPQAKSKKREDTSLEEVSPPPPGHTTELTSAVVQHAMNLQPRYKAQDYKEHGQLVMARVMASSPEFHEDKDETQETLDRWREAVPIQPKQGWRDVADFIRAWRQHFLAVCKPKHLSAEWTVDNPI